MKGESEVSITEVNFFDIEFLWYLRNQPEVYKYSRHNRMVNWKEHVSWILPIILGVSNKELFIIKNSKIPIGQIRFDYKNHNEAKVSISILKEFWGREFSIKSLNLVIKQIKKAGKIQALIAEIHEDNIPSIKLFEKLNFKFKTRKGNWLKYRLNLYDKKT